MSKQILVKHFEESEFAKEPCQATEGSAGYDLYVEETKTFLPNSADTVSIELRSFSYCRCRLNDSDFRGLKRYW